MILFDADLSATQLGARRRSHVTIGEVVDTVVADLFADYVTARAAADSEQMALILDHAKAIDPALVDELYGFDYLAAA